MFNKYMISQEAVEEVLKCVLEDVLNFSGLSCIYYLFEKKMLIMLMSVLVSPLLFSL